MSSANKIIILHFYASYLFFFQIAPASASCTMLNRSGECGHPCDVTDSCRKVFNLSQLSMTCSEVRVGGLLLTGFQCWMDLQSGLCIQAGLHGQMVPPEGSAVPSGCRRSQAAFLGEVVPLVLLHN